MMRLLTVLTLSAAVAGCASMPPAAPEIPTAVRPAQAPDAAAADFLEAFNALDSARFDSFFTDDVTMFFPAGPFPKGRVVGKPAVTASFRSFFDLAKQRGATRLNIQPVGLTVQDYGDVAVVSFELTGGKNIGRRSIVFRNQDGAWRIVHFHASALEAGS